MEEASNKICPLLNQRCYGERCMLYIKEHTAHNEVNPEIKLKIENICSIKAMGMGILSLRKI